MSEKVQVAYDRIMCEHMRNICISQQQLKFFTKRLNSEEISELLSVLTEMPGGYQITWVADSILKYNAFRDSRSNNRKGKTKEHMKKTSATSVKHMENESGNVNEDDLSDRGVGKENPVIPQEQKAYLGPRMVEIYTTHFTDYPPDPSLDYPASLDIALKIATAKGWSHESVTNGKMPHVLKEWEVLVRFAKGDIWYATQSISMLNKKFQELVLASKKTGKHGKSHFGGHQSATSGGQDPTRIEHEGFGRL